jgi:hypothetical protein
MLLQRKYHFADGPVCVLCGEKGHAGGSCDTPCCGRCGLMAHETALCGHACSTCGRFHDPPVGERCMEARCGECSLYGALEAGTGAAGLSESAGSVRSWWCGCARALLFQSDAQLARLPGPAQRCSTPTLERRQSRALRACAR